MMLVGFLITGPIAAVEGVPAHLHGTAWVWLALSGGGNVLGLLIGYQAFRSGQLAVVIPIISTEGALAAVIAFVAGESVSVGTGVALVVAAVGVSITSIPAEPAASGAASGLHVRTVLLSLTAALIFGVSLYATGRASAILPSAWVVLAARVVGSVALALPLALRGRLKLTRQAAPLVVASGVAEVVGFFSYAFGTRHGIAVAAVIASQFAAISVAFAYFFFGERLTRSQLVGICTILVGVSLLSAASS
jgi:drug/metabolite transporter (DMT)-like permease